MRHAEKPDKPQSIKVDKKATGKERYSDNEDIQGFKEGDEYNMQYGEVIVGSRDGARIKLHS